MAPATHDARSRFRRLSILQATPVARAAGALVIIIGSSILGAWASDMAAASALVPGLNRMNPVTAASLILAGVALILPRRGPVAGAGRVALGGAICAVAAVKLAGLATGHDPSIDVLLFPDAVRGLKRSLMAPTTAVALHLLGFAIALTPLRSHRANLVAQGLAAATLTIATVALIGYFYGAVALYEFSGPAAMALHTAISLAAAAVAVLWTRPGLGVTGIFTSPGLGGVTARRLLMTLALATIVLGAGRAELVRNGLLDELTAGALMVALLYLVIAVAVLSLALQLQRLTRRLAARERSLQEAAIELTAARDEAQAAAAVKASFMANISHEIRTPLTAIVGYADMLARRQDLDAQTASQVSRIERAAHALGAIVNDVLDFSKLEAGRVTIRLEPVDPRRLFEDTLLLFDREAAAKGLSVDFQAEGDLPAAVLIDPDRTRQILLNLIGNAVKFTESGWVRLVASHDQGWLRVRVEDTGRGLTPTQQQALFQRFSQVDAASTGQHGGTGLGLAICKGLVEAMNGEIGVRSRPGGGSAFHFMIAAPVSTGPSAKVAPRVPES